MGEFISLFTAICWTITVITFEKAGRDVGSLAVNFLRLVFGLVFLMIFLLVTKGQPLPIDAPFDTWNYLLLSGIIGLFLGDAFLFQAFIDVGGRTTLVILTLVPPVSAVLDYLVFGETIAFWQVVGMFITLVAIVFVVLAKEDNVNHKHVTRGIAFAIFGALGQAFGLLFSKLGLQEYDAFAATEIRVISALIGFIIFITIAGKWRHVTQTFKKTFALKYILLGSFFGPFLGIGSNLLALKLIPIGIASTIAQLNLLFIIPFSVLLFNEKVNKRELFGSLVAFAGVAILFIV
jgi:drug/metabolite transporter (DMT)-like permease